MCVKAELVNMGPPISFYLGLKVDRDMYVCREKRTIKLNQPGLYQETSLLQILPQTKLKPNRILQWKESIQLLSNNEKIATKFERKEYQGITGSTMFSLVVETRPDIAFAMSVASRFAKKIIRVTFPLKP